MDDAAQLAALLAGCHQGLSRRDLVLAAPCRRPPPDGAWAPGVFSVQIPLRGRIELGIPRGDELDWRIIGPRHILAVCPDSWSPRTSRHARQHLALSLGPRLQVSRFDTPAGGGGRCTHQHIMVEPGAALRACLEATRVCAASRPTPAVLHGLICSLVALLVDELRASPVDRSVCAARTFIREHCRETLSRETVAAQLGIGGDHLTRLLQAAEGCGFVDLVHRYRLERAGELLRDPTLSVAAVAEACGYGSASYFIRVFRRQRGCSPTVWRQGWQSADGPAA